MKSIYNHGDEAYLLSSRGSLFIWNSLENDVRELNNPLYDGTELAFSNCGSLSAQLDSRDRKTLNIHTANSAKSITFPRRVSSFLFSHDSKGVMVADKRGDVFFYDIVLDETNFILSHISAITCMCNLGDQLVGTADRNGKIRVSLPNPNCFLIESTLLGHVGPVFGLYSFVAPSWRLVSLGRDCTFLWDVETGEPLARSNALSACNAWCGDRLLLFSAVGNVITTVSFCNDRIDSLGECRVDHVVMDMAVVGRDSLVVHHEPDRFVIFKISDHLGLNRCSFSLGNTVEQEETSLKTRCFGE